MWGRTVPGRGKTGHGCALPLHDVPPRQCGSCSRLGNVRARTGFIRRRVADALRVLHGRPARILRSLRDSDLFHGRVHPRPHRPHDWQPGRPRLDRAHISLLGIQALPWLHVADDLPSYLNFHPRPDARTMAWTFHRADAQRKPPQIGSQGIDDVREQDQATDASINDYIDSRADEQQRADCQELMALLASITKESPRMWGPSIVGYGSYRYTYESGRTGEAPLAAFAIRGRELVVYLDCEGERSNSLLARLGKHKMGKACLYFKRLADLDKSVLEQLVTASMTDVQRRHG